MTGYVDIHSHLLPGIDDGPEDMAGTLAMAAAAAESGTAVLAATPHLRSDFPGVHVAEIAERCDRVQVQIDAASIPLRVVAAAETSMVWALEASDEDLRRATYAQRGDDLLVETPSDVSMLEHLLYQVRLRLGGVRVTLAHPERSSTFKREPEQLAHLHEQGILLQVNADSLLAARASSTRRLAEQLCREGLAHVLASDGHRGAEWRPVSALGAGAQALAELVGPARAAWMTAQAPGAIVEGLPLPEAPELDVPRRPFWRPGRR